MKKLLFACLMAFSVSSHAEFITGNKLLSLITSKSDIENSFAYGYVAGVFDLGHGVTHCAPDNVTVRQVNDMTVRVLQKLPQHREKSADQFVLLALQEAWPCKKASPSTGKSV